MSEYFDKFYCPHCNVSLDVKLKPKKCFHCGGLIVYGGGGTKKALFDLPELPIKVKDVIIFMMAVGAIGYTIYLYFQKKHLIKKIKT